jgi:ribosome-binding factor A
MQSHRLTRVNELLRREIGEALFRVLHEGGFDLSAVTITRVEVSRNLRHARVGVSIRDHEAERARMLGIIQRHRPEIQDRINRDLTLKYTPRLTFELDTSVERGDRVLGILHQLEPPEPEETPGDGAPTP